MQSDGAALSGPGIEEELRCPGSYSDRPLFGSAEFIGRNRAAAAACAGGLGREGVAAQSEIRQMRILSLDLRRRRLLGISRNRIVRRSGSRSSAQAE